jgi:hypothetical protein
LESLLPASAEDTVKIVDQESRMSLGRGPEVLLHPEMNLHGFTFEPATAARGEFRGFGSFGKLEHVAIELSRKSFAARRYRELYVIYSDDGHDRLRAI